MIAVTKRRTIKEEEIKTTYIRITKGGEKIINQNFFQNEKKLTLKKREQEQNERIMKEGGEEGTNINFSLFIFNLIFL